MARPKEIKLSPEQLVADLAGLGHSKTEIARLLDISVDTLDRRYAEVYGKGREQGKSKLRRKLYDTAIAGNVTAMIFLAKNMLGMSDKVSAEVSTPEGGSLVIEDARSKLAGLLSGIATRTTAPVDPVAAQ